MNLKKLKKKDDCKSYNCLEEIKLTFSIDSEKLTQNLQEIYKKLKNTKVKL